MFRIYPAARLAAMTLVASTVTAAAGAAFAAPAAQATDDPRAIVVSYADLNLQRPGDAEKLLARLDTASRAVCEPHRQGQQDLRSAQAYRACRTHAMDVSVAAIGSSRLNAAYAAHPAGQLVLADQRH